MEETEREIVKCWFCTKDILAEAKKCKHCGEWVRIDKKKEEIKQNTKNNGILRTSNSLTR